MPRKIIFEVANSLDNFIAREDGGVDWLLGSDDINKLLGDLWKTIDSVFMGRKTFEAALKLGGGDGSFPGVMTYVFSKTMKPSTSKGVQIISEDAVEWVRRFKKTSGKDVMCMGGGEFARPLLEAGVIDEIRMNTHPVLLGTGVPMFLTMKKQIDLELVKCLPIKHDCVYLTYRVKNAEAKPSPKPRKKKAAARRKTKGAKK